MGILVPTKTTSVQFPQLMEATILAWIKLFNEIPNKESICVLLSQNALESGQTKNMFNFNIGNVKYVEKDPNDGIKYMMLRNVYEYINGKKIYFQPPSKVTWFRSFDTLEEGLVFHLDKLKNGRFNTAWNAVISGNVEEFAHQLKLKQYYTASESSYAAGMRSYFNKYMKDLTYEKVIESLPTQEFSIFPLNPQ